MGYESSELLLVNFRSVPVRDPNSPVSDKCSTTRVVVFNGVDYGVSDEQGAASNSDDDRIARVERRVDLLAAELTAATVGRDRAHEGISKLLELLLNSVCPRLVASTAGLTQTSRLLSSAPNETSNLCRTSRPIRPRRSARSGPNSNRSPTPQTTTPHK